TVLSIRLAAPASAAASVAFWSWTRAAITRPTSIASAAAAINATSATSTVTIATPRRLRRRFSSCRFLFARISASSGRGPRLRGSPGSAGRRRHHDRELRRAGAALRAVVAGHHVLARAAVEADGPGLVGAPRLRIRDLGVHVLAV